MAKSKWLSEVAEALRRQRLSRAYIRRFTDELADHCEDLCQETLGMDANAFPVQMGSADELARTATHEFRRRTYAGRHPLVTFVAAPLPTAALLLVSLCAAFLLVLSVAPESSPADDVPAWAAVIMHQELRHGIEEIGFGSFGFHGLLPWACEPGKRAHSDHLPLQR
ncbi:MAG: hypothetical protein WD894_21735 [Pirellulales bacterium]